MLPSKPQEEAAKRTCTSCPTKRTISCQSQRYKRSGYSPQLPRYTKLDANSGFWQVPLAKESRLLTTSVTPFGRYCFNRLPFGICSAPEVFQRTMSSVLEGLEGVICHMDDTLIHGPTQEVHDTQVRLVLNRL